MDSAAVCNGDRVGIPVCLRLEQMEDEEFTPAVEEIDVCEPAGATHFLLPHDIVCLELVTSNDRFQELLENSFAECTLLVGGEVLVLKFRLFVGGDFQEFMLLKDPDDYIGWTLTEMLEKYRRMLEGSNYYRTMSRI